MSGEILTECFVFGHQPTPHKNACLKKYVLKRKLKVDTEEASKEFQSWGPFTARACSVQLVQGVGSSQIYFGARPNLAFYVISNILKYILEFNL